MRFSDHWIPFGETEKESFGGGVSFGLGTTRLEGWRGNF